MYRIHRERERSRAEERDRKGGREGGLSWQPAQTERERMGCQRGLWTTGGRKLCVCLCVNECPCVYVHDNLWIYLKGKSLNDGSVHINHTQLRGSIVSG